MLGYRVQMLWGLQVLGSVGIKQELKDLGF